MNDTQLNNRQLAILKYLATKQSSSRRDLGEFFKNEQFSKITLIRDLNLLIKQGWLKQTGGGKYVTYSISSNKALLIPVDIDEYFQTSTDARYVKYPKFNRDVINNLTDIFSPTESGVFEKGQQKFASRFAMTDQTIFKRELERFIIEFSWKSSHIEGNTYSLLETEELIKNKKEAKGHDRAEAIMILNHKTTFDLILSKRKSFQTISDLDIRTIHSELTKDLDIKPNIREFAVGIVGTKYAPLGNKFQIEDALHCLTTYVNKINSIPEKSLILLAMISYLQPFSDGNKRTARMVSNAILLANDYYPLSYRSVDELEFKKALILFYEQNNLFHLKRIFLEQQQFAIDNYFL